MPEADDTHVFLELTQYSLHALRAVNGKIEAGGECVLENKSALEALLDAVAPTRKADSGIRAGTAVWPPAAQWYLSTDTEAMLDRSGDAMRTIAGARQKDPRASLVYASCNATDGGEVTSDGMDKWVMAFAPLESLENVSKTLMGMGVDPDEMKPAGLTALGAVSTAMRAENNDGGVVIWDIGAEQSTLILMTPMGVAETVPCSAGMDAIFEGVQQALKLKFRGAGARLFFNEGYDFTDPGPKIAAVVGKAVKEALSRFPKTASPPLLTSLSLTGKQAWFIREVAAYVGLQAWEPSMPKLAGKLGLSFKDPELETAFSPASTGLFELVSMRIRPRDRWNPEWVEAAEVVEDDMQVVEDNEQITEMPPPREPEIEPEPPVRIRPSLSTSPQSNAPSAPRPGSRPPVPPRPAGSIPPMPAVGATTRPPIPRPAPVLFPTAASAAPPPVRPATRPPVPLPDSGTPSFPAPGGGAPAFPSPGGGAPRPPSFPSPGGGMPAFPSPGGAPSFPAPGGGPPRPPSFPSPGGGAPSFPGPSGGMSQPPFPSPGQAPNPAPFPSAYPAPEPGGMPSFPTPGGTSAPHAYPPPGPPSAAPFPGAGAPPPPNPTSYPVPEPEPFVPEVPLPPVTALPFEAVKLRPLGAPGSKVPPGVTKAPFGTTRPAFAPEPAKSKLGRYLAIGVAAALIFAAVAVVVEARLERIKANDLEQQEELARHITEQRLKEAEQSSKDQQEASRKEMELAIAQARRDAEEEAKKSIQAQDEAARQAKVPGTVIATSVPSGASVSVDGAPPVTTPAHLGNLSVGTHHFHFSRTGYDPVDVDGEAKAGITTNLDTVTLTSIYGSAEFTSVPDGLDYTVKPAGDLLARPVANGTTPGVLAQLPHGDYIATFHRPACHDHFENFTVAEGERVAVTTTYQDGSLELSSDPSGASVNKDGSFIGTTPLILHNLTPKVASFELNLPGYDVTPVSCDIPEGTTLKYSAQLLRKDRVFTSAEVKTPPTKLEGSMPQLSPSEREAGGSAVLSFVVRRDGSVGYVEVVRSTDDDIARRCQGTVEAWKYRAATAPDDRVVDSRIEVSFKFPPGS